MEKVLLCAVNDGIVKACPLSVFALVVASVCVNTAELQQALPAIVQGPDACVVGAFPESVSTPNGVGALSA